MALDYCAKADGSSQTWTWLRPGPTRRTAALACSGSCRPAGGAGGRHLRCVSVATGLPTGASPLFIATQTRAGHWASWIQFASSHRLSSCKRQRFRLMLRTYSVRASTGTPGILCAFLQFLPVSLCADAAPPATRHPARGRRPSAWQRQAPHFCASLPADGDTCCVIRQGRTSGT
jgi:hypothetical protein